MEVVRLCCEQLPGVAVLGISQGSSTTYLAHAQQFVGFLRGNMERTGSSRALSSFLKSDSGKVLRENDGGDLLSAIQKGPLNQILYSHPMQPLRKGTTSQFVTIDGMKELLNKFPLVDATIRSMHHDISTSRLSFVPYVPQPYTRKNREDRPDDFPQTTEKRPRQSKGGIYVLKFNDGVKPTFYVGKSKDISLRMQQHASGEGAGCVSGRSFTEVKPITSGTPGDMESWERSETLERMYQFGIDTTRGWKYVFAVMPLSQKLSAFDDVCERFDLCRRCGRGSHFVRECEALTTDRWAGGLELRPFYHSQPDDDALRHAKAKANEERNKRLDAERRNAEAIRILSASSL